MSQNNNKPSMNKPSVQFINNPNFYFGSDAFLLKNGDCYIGGFCSHKSGIVWREGLGVYNTDDGHSYHGFWDNDRLNGTQTTIKYPSGAQYLGSLKRGKYSGTGTLTLNSEITLNCNFKKNVPLGDVTMKDSNNITWKGAFNVDQAILMSENSFFSNLTYDIGRDNKKSN
ncbi:hypothetical protein CBL_13305 [Carabus blaptoides fortunei]